MEKFKNINSDLTESIILFFYDFLRSCRTVNRQWKSKIDFGLIPVLSYFYLSQLPNIIKKLLCKHKNTFRTKPSALQKAQTSTLMTKIRMIFRAMLFKAVPFSGSGIPSRCYQTMKNQNCFGNPVLNVPKYCNNKKLIRIE